MERRSKIREAVRTVWFMLVVTFMAISAVSALHLTTQEAVARNASFFLRKAIAEATGAIPPATAEASQAWYQSSVTAFPDDRAPDRFEVRDTAWPGGKRHAFVRSGSGLWGRITAVIGMDADLITLTGMTIVEHNETPGLGARITEEGFTRQFKGKRAPFTLVPEGTRSEAPGEIDAITGATITSVAMKDLMNRTSAEAQRLAGVSGEETRRGETP